jgi:1-acyl-sn-glycerol-3-phosphate acyltransferase
MAHRHDVEKQGTDENQRLVMKTLTNEASTFDIANVSDMTGAAELEIPLEMMPVAYGNAGTVTGAAIAGIDDSMAVGFSYKKFNAVRFTIGKRVSLFFEHSFPWFVQSMFVPIFQVIYRTVFVLRIKGKENLKDIKGPVIFVSNHIGFYDSFIFDLFVPSFSNVMPFRFMGSRRFLSPFLSVLKVIGIVDLVYFLFGVFRITPGEGAEKSLKKAYEIIWNDGTVVMYPEGRIWKPTNVHPEEVGPFKWGAAILAKNTGAKVIPISFKKTYRTDKNGFMKVRRQIDVNIGAPYLVSRRMAREKIADDMRKRVVGLYDAS